MPKRAVHPRGRGEHSSISFEIQRGDGSSPRARGTRTAGADRRSSWRFIPAGAGNTVLRATEPCRPPVHPRGRGEHGFSRSMLSRCGRFIPAGAGNTRCEAIWPAWATVHPRGRGEHIRACAAPAFASGSSPRARGTPIYLVQTASDSRFIPAGAGNTSLPPSRLVSLAVHPRGRGEHTKRNRLFRKKKTGHAKSTDFSC